MLKCSAVEYVIRRVQINHDRLKLNGTHHPLVYAVDVNTMDASVHTVKKDTGASVDASKGARLEVNAYKLRTWSFLEIRTQDEVTI